MKKNKGKGLTARRAWYASKPSKSNCKLRMVKWARPRHGAPQSVTERCIYNRKGHLVLKMMGLGRKVLRLSVCEAIPIQPRRELFLQTPPQPGGSPRLWEELGLTVMDTPEKCSDASSSSASTTADTDTTLIGALCVIQGLNCWR